MLDILVQHKHRIVSHIADAQGEWLVKGIQLRDYTVSIPYDTKLISKIFEIQIQPIFQEIAKEYNLTLIPAKYQNYYPDFSFIDQNGIKYAVDIKSSYRKSSLKINKFTLGTYKGYFRNPKSTKNIQFPYEQYAKHISLCIFYDKARFDAINNIDVWMSPTWMIASNKTGSGNTCNIGSIESIADIYAGKSFFQSEQEYYDYWRNF